MVGLLDAIFNNMPGQSDEEKRMALANSLISAGGAMFDASQGAPGAARRSLGASLIAGARGMGQGMEASRVSQQAQREAAIKQQLQGLQAQQAQQALDINKRLSEAQQRFASNPRDMAALAAAYPEVAAKMEMERQMLPLELAKASALAGQRASMPLNPLQQMQMAVMQNKLTNTNNEKAAQNANAISNLENTISTADDLLKHPGLSRAVGKSSYFPSVRGSDAYDFEAKLASFKAQTFLPMVSFLKGMGSLTEAEGKKLEAAVGALDIGMGEESFNKSLNEIRADLVGKMQRLKGFGSQQNSADVNDALAALGVGM